MQIIIQKMKGLVFVAAFIGLAYGGHIDIPPQNVSVVAGTNVNLTCRASGDLSIFRLSWKEHIEDPTGALIFNSAMSGPNDEEEFEIHGKYDLIIREANIEDGGVYSCGLDGGTTYKINVNVINRPVITIPELYEGRTQSIECFVEYGSTAPSFMNPRNIPRIQARIETDITEGEETERIVGLLGQPSSIKYVVNVTSDKLDHLRTFSCEVVVDEPEFKVGDRKIMHVIHEVSEVEIEPKRQDFYVGEKLTCTSHGHPEPNYRWMPVASPGSRQVTGSVLEIEENMIGVNRWKCSATNDAGNGIREETEEVEFTVLPATEAPGSSASIIKSTIFCLMFSGLISRFI